MTSGGYRWSPKGDLNPSWKGGLITDPEWFRKSYEEDGLPLREVAKKASCSLRTASRWAKKHGIKLRKPGPKGSTIGENHHNWKGGRFRACITCEGRASRRSGKSLGRCQKCYSKTFNGKGNPNYKGTADVKKLVRGWCSSFWTPEVLKRGSYTCASCGDSSGGNLVAHHIKCLAPMIDRLLVENNISLLTEDDRLNAVTFLCAHSEITDLTNGVALCTKCHQKLHSGSRRDVVHVEL